MFDEQINKPMDPQLYGMLMQQPVEQRITQKDIAEATATMEKYKAGKANLERRIIENEQWYKMRHWEVLRKEYNKKCKAADELPIPEPSSGWLFNAIASKHADAMDNFPEPLVLPRERSDEQSADQLSEVLPVILELSDYEDTYSQAWWDKLKNGFSIYSTPWNSELENGLGDVEVQCIDPLRIYWEPGITKIQKSRNLFVVELVDQDVLEDQYPNMEGKLKGNGIDVSQYVYDDTVDISQKVLVVDWYYRRRHPDGRMILHYCRFCGDQILFASENEPEYQEKGWYWDGEYPVVFDVLFPEAGTPVGFGYVDLCKDPQMYIDKLWSNILRVSGMTTNRKFFVSDNADMNEQELLDPNKMLVHVAGEVGDQRIKEWMVRPLESVYINLIQMKIDELKDCASNRDVNNGGSGSGITAAAAISALQEAGNKTSRDMIKGGYSAQRKVYTQVTERCRQFMDVARSFRITNSQGDYDFIQFSNAAMQEQPVQPYEGQELQPDYVEVFRVPVYDIKISAQRKNPFSRMEQNERAMQLFQLGFFNPEMATPALSCLEMMEFEGIEKIKDKVREGQTLLAIIQQMQVQLQQMAMMLDQVTGGGMMQGGGEPPAEGQDGPRPAASGKPAQDPAHQEIMASQEPQTGYQERLAQRSTPKV